MQLRAELESAAAGKHWLAAADSIANEIGALAGELGIDGAEVMEFRNVTHFNIDFTGTGPGMMAKIAELSRAKADTWRNQKLPEAVQRFGISSDSDK